MLNLRTLATWAAVGRGLILPLVNVWKVSTSPCDQIANGPEVSRARHVSWFSYDSTIAATKMDVSNTCMILIVRIESMIRDPAALLG